MSGKDMPVLQFSVLKWISRKLYWCQQIAANIKCAKLSSGLFLLHLTYRYIISPAFYIKPTQNRFTSQIVNLILTHPCSKPYIRAGLTNLQNLSTLLLFFCPFHPQPFLHHWHCTESGFHRDNPSNSHCSMLILWNKS